MPLDRGWDHPGAAQCRRGANPGSTALSGPAPVSRAHPRAGTGSRSARLAVSLRGCLGLGVGDDLLRVGPGGVHALAIAVPVPVRAAVDPLPHVAAATPCQ